MDVFKIQEERRGERRRRGEVGTGRGERSGERRGEKRRGEDTGEERGKRRGEGEHQRRGCGELMIE